VAMAKGLREYGLLAPEIHHADLDQGLLVIEDLGDERVVAGEPPVPIEERYETAVDALLALHERALPDLLPVAPHLEYQIPAYELEAFLIEAELLLDWYLKRLGVEMAQGAREEFRMVWREALQPAIGLARNGVEVYGELYRSWNEPTEPGHLDTLTRAQATKACEAIFTRDGRLHRPGEVLVQADLARTLEVLAAEGPDTFYHGSLARRIAEDLHRHGAFVTAEDLAAYEAEVRAPVTGPYRGWRVSSSPPPGSGVQILQILNILEGYELGAMDPASADYVYLWIQAQRYSFADRTRHLGDPAFVEVPVDLLTSKAYAAELRRRIDAGESVEVPKVAAARPEHTTQVTTLDGAGNAVSLTHTLGTSAGVVTPGLGFMYNNAMYQFNPLPGSPNSIEPGKRRITGISPSFVFKDGRLRLALGGPGGTRILTGIAAVIVNVIDHAMTVVEAVSAPRVYCDGPVARIEGRLFHGVERALRARGERIRCSEFSYDPFFSPVSAILIDAERDRATAASDPRAGGGVVVVR